MTLCVRNTKSTGSLGHRPNMRKWGEYPVTADHVKLYIWVSFDRCLSHCPLNSSSKLPYHPPKGLMGSFHLAVTLRVICCSHQLTNPKLWANLSYYLTGEGLALVCEYSVGCSKNQDKPFIEDLCSSQHLLILGHISPGVSCEMVHNYQVVFDLRQLI